MSFCSLFVAALPLSHAFQPVFSVRRNANMPSKLFVTNTAFISEDDMYSDFPADEDRHDATNHFQEDIKMPSFDTFSPALKVSPEDVAEADKAAMAATLSSKDLLQRDSNKQGRKVRASVRETGYDSIKSYIKTMCNHELLNKNEEVILAREIQILIKWEETREGLEASLLRCVACS